MHMVSKPATMVGERTSRRTKGNKRLEGRLGWFSFEALARIPAQRTRARVRDKRSLKFPQISRTSFEQLTFAMMFDGAW